MCRLASQLVPRHARDTALLQQHLASREDAAGRPEQVRRVGGRAEVVAAADAPEQRDEVANARDGEGQPLSADQNISEQCLPDLPGWDRRGLACVGLRQKRLLALRGAAIGRACAG